MSEGDKRRHKFSLSSASKLFFVISLAGFMLVQLITNAILSPLGHELQSLNYEKNALIEDNRTLSQVVAKDSSITIIKVYSEGKFDISAKAKHKSVFISNQSIQALK